jgi:methionyl-tRNA formyltransferase
MKIYVFAKDKPGLKNSLEFLKQLPVEVQLFQGTRGEPFPETVYQEPPDIAVSYMSPWIIPEKFLNVVKLTSVNFHPGPPEYPGTGCTNFALYHGVKEFGVTAHVMNPKVDTGVILGVKRFPILEQDTVETLTLRCYEAIEVLFKELMPSLIEGKIIPNGEQWQRKAFLRKELDELCRITPDMTSDEVKKRIRATTYPGMPGPFVEIHGHKFILKN